MKPLAKAWSIAWTPPDRSPIPQWCARYVPLPSLLTVTGMFNPDLSRHFLAIFDALQDDLTRYVELMKPVDSGGSLIGDLWTTWVPPNDPGAMLITFQSDAAVKKHAETRINPMLEACQPCRELFPADRNKKRIQEIIFSNGMPLYMQGPSLGNLQSQRIRYLRNEEIWMWPAGLRAEALGRIRNWEDIGMSKVFEPSQGGIEGDELDEAWQAGTQEEWCVPCAACGKYSEAVWGGKRPNGSRWGIVWNDDDHCRDKEGNWILSAVLPTVRWECQHCGHPHLFESCRDNWNRLGHYEARNPSAGPVRRSFHFDAIIVRSWEKQVQDFLLAIKAFRLGVEEPLKAVVQKDRARSWSETFAPADRRTEKYDLSKPFEVQGETGMAVDCQTEGEFPTMVATWSADRKCYVREYRICLSEIDLQAVQAQYKIPPAWVFVDSGWGATTRDVYAMCARNGWIACKGADELSYTIYIKKKDGRTVGIERCYRSFKGDPELRAGRGPGARFCMGLRWSNFTIKSRLSKIIAKGRWIEPQFNENDPKWKRYQREMGGERLKSVRRKTDNRLIRRWVAVGPNLAWDCACMTYLRAVVRGLLPDVETEEREQTKTEE